ncbi:hypothetical protein ACFYRL_28170 [Streptomyces goshikiensis]|uniref:hypothetical protein n=1 Tax=Streptomyces goshikiensis TaxID=1942 RepID=UPI0036C642D8
MTGRHTEEEPVASPDGMSVTHQLARYTWSDKETAAYEAAIEAVNGAVGAYSAVIAAEERGPGADPGVIAGARSAQSRLAREREGLRSTDHEQIAEARAHYARLALDVLARIA